MEFYVPIKAKRKKALEGRSYFGWIFMRPASKWGIVRKRFALFPVRIDSSTVVWFHFYYSFLVQADDSGLHSGWNWRLKSRALNPMKFRGHSLNQEIPSAQGKVLHLQGLR